MYCSTRSGHLRRTTMNYRMWSLFTRGCRNTLTFRLRILTVALTIRGAKQPVISYCKMTHDFLLLNIAQAGLELMVLYPEPTERSPSRYAPPCLSTELLFIYESTPSGDFRSSTWLLCLCYLSKVYMYFFCTEKCYFHSSKLGIYPLVRQSFPVGIPKLSTSAASGWICVFVNCNVIVIPECHSLLFIYLDKLRTVVICHCMFLNMVVGPGDMA